MIDYDKNKWYFIVFSFDGTVIRAMVVRLSIFVGLTILLAVLQDYHYHIPQVNSTLHTLLGTGLSLLLVFRTNSSYDRYWEGRKLIGSIVNNNRSLMRSASCYTKPGPNGPATLVQYMHGFVDALKYKLRIQSLPENFQNIFTIPGEYAKISKFPNMPTACLYMMSRWVEAQLKSGNVERWEARTLESYIAALGECQGGLERIANTPIPFAYAAHTHQFLMLYLITLPFTMVFTYQYYAIPVVFIVAFGLLGVDEAGVEIEDPFGTDENDLPLETIFGNIVRDAKAIVELDGPGIPQEIGEGAGSFSVKVQVDDTAVDDAE